MKSREVQEIWYKGEGGFYGKRGDFRGFIGENGGFGEKWWVFLENEVFMGFWS